MRAIPFHEKRPGAPASRNARYSATRTAAKRPKNDDLWAFLVCGERNKQIERLYLNSAADLLAEILAR